jgi:hypothetical protein
MKQDDEVYVRLLSYMEEALKVCRQLQAFSEEKMAVFADGEDQEIIELIQSREGIINTLVSLEYKIDLILDEADEYGYGDGLPPKLTKSAKPYERCSGA